MGAHTIAILLLHHLGDQLKFSTKHLGLMHSIAKPSMTTVRLIHMPPQPAEDRRASLFGHTDNGSITILFNVISGLQILPPGVPNEECNWRWVRPEPGFAIVNLGDALVQWSGGILRSNFHRVVNPAGQQAECDRYSFAYVLKPDNDAPMRKLVGSAKAWDEFEDNDYVYRDWLSVKAVGSRNGRNIIRIGASTKPAATERPEVSTRIEKEELVDGSIGDGIQQRGCWVVAVELILHHMDDPVNSIQACYCCRDGDASQP